MNNKIPVIDDNNSYIKIIKKFVSIVLVMTSISFLLILFSFHPEDFGWGFISENVPRNFFGQIGAFFSGLIIREFGILPGLLFSLVLFIWSLKLFNGTLIENFKIKFLSIILIIFFSSLGGSYVETEIIQKLNLNFPILSQKGLSEWLLFNFSNKFSEFTALNFAVSILIIGITSVVISLCLFVWVSSAGLKGNQVF